MKTVKINTTIPDDGFFLHLGIGFNEEYLPDYEFSSSAAQPNEFAELIVNSKILGFIPKRIHEEPVPTLAWINLFGRNVMVTPGNGGTPFSLAVDSVLVARTAEGIPCGRFVVSEDGKFGFMPVYGDDPYTAFVKEGPTQGEQFYLYLNGVRCDAELHWSAFGASIEITELHLQE